MGARLLSFFALAVAVIADAWVPVLLGSLWCVHAACALYRPAATLDRILEPLEVLCADDKLASFHDGDLLWGSFHHFGSSDTFDQLVPMLLALLLVLAHG